MRIAFKSQNGILSHASNAHGLFIFVPCFIALFILMLLQVPSALATVQVQAGHKEASNLAESITVEKQIPLALVKNVAAHLQTVRMSWQTVATLKFSPPPHGDSAYATQEALQTGNLIWRISPDGTQIIDNTTGLRATVTTLTRSNVRPRDMLYQPQQGLIWLYGETVYRYRMAEHKLERLQLEEDNFHAIRKAVSGDAGLWLATEKGIFLLDKKEATLKKIVHPAMGNVNIINAAANGREVWFAADSVVGGARLIRLGNRTADQIEFASSARLLGTPAELILINQSLWMLLSDSRGEHYKISFIDKELQHINRLNGKYYSLVEKDGQLLASAYSTFFRIDPVARTLTRVELKEAGLLSRAASKSSVLFIGTSYAYRDNCEIVERGRVDISKGWINALNDWMFH